MKTVRLNLLFLTLALVGAVYSSCSLLNPNSDDNSLNIFSLTDDIKLGQQLKKEVESNPSKYGPVLSEAQNREAYGHLRRIRDKILNSGRVALKDKFQWEVKIIDKEVLNAFCAPGGYIYVYTGLIKFLDSEDDFAGVLAHEIAHADRRHSTDQLTEAYGIQTLLQIALGEASQNQLTQIATGLLSLKFSRKRETEADKYSVKYLCGTNYAANGAGSFFKKMLTTQQGGQPPVFLSTHPSPANRVSDINKEAIIAKCSTAQNPSARTKWKAFQASVK